MTSREMMLYLVDDDPSIRKAVARLLRSAGYAVSVFATAEEFLAAKLSRSPGCLILDLQMPGLNGLDLQNALITTHRAMPTVFISGHGDIPSSVRAMKGGAVDFLTKPFDRDEFLAAVTHAIDKSRREYKTQRDQTQVQHHADKLTARERQVMEQVVSGRLNKQIAARLKISEKTVKVHRARVMEKMRVGSLAELVRISEKTNLLVDGWESVRRVQSPTQRPGEVC